MCTKFHNDAGLLHGTKKFQGKPGILLRQTDECIYVKIYSALAYKHINYFSIS